MKRGGITREDVATRAGVSTAVVSYVPNDGPRPVSIGTRARVEAAIRELGYYPNELARSLRVQSTSIIGLTIPSIKNPVADISIVGYDDTVSSTYLNPPLTTIELPKREMGSEAARMILALVGHLRETSSGTLTLPVRLVVRASTAEPRLAA